MCLAQYKTADKSNEITAIPVILDWLELAGSVVTIDAMGCQRAIASKIIGQQADYVLALKENQAGLLLAVSQSFESSAINENSADFFEHSERGHGRLEKRTCRVLPSKGVPWWGNAQDWEGLKSVIEVSSERTILATNQKQAVYCSHFPRQFRRAGSDLRTTAARKRPQFSGDSGPRFSAPIPAGRL